MKINKDAKTSPVSRATTGTARSGETSSEAFLLGQLHKEVTSVQNYDSEPLEKLVKSSAVATRLRWRNEDSNK